MTKLSTFMQQVGPQQNVLMDLYPDLIPRRVDAKGEEFIQCNADGMRANQAFINHLMSNNGRFQGLTHRLEEQLVALQKIHSKLDDVLQSSGSKTITLHEN